jgi:hypothetical protein
MKIDGKLGLRLLGKLEQFSCLNYDSSDLMNFMIKKSFENHSTSINHMNHSSR